MDEIHFMTYENSCAHLMALRDIMSSFIIQI